MLKIQTNDKFNDQICILDVVKQQIKYSIDIKNDDELIASNRNLILLWKAGSECLNESIDISLTGRDDFVKVYMIKQSHIYEIKQLKNIELNFTPLIYDEYRMYAYGGLIKCYFLDDSTTKFILMVYNIMKNCFEIIECELNIVEEQIEIIKKSKIKLFNFPKLVTEYSKEGLAGYFMTHQDKLHVHFYCISSNLNDNENIYEINCIDRNNGNLINEPFQFKLKLNQLRPYPNILPLCNENDFIVYSEQNSYFNYFKIGFNKKHENLVNLEHSLNEISMVNENLLCLLCYEKQTVWIKHVYLYDLKSMNKIFSIRSSYFTCIIQNLKYFIIADELFPKCIRVFQLYDGKNVLNMRLNYSSSDKVLFCNNKYLLVLLEDNKLISFKFNDA